MRIFATFSIAARLCAFDHCSKLDDHSNMARQIQDEWHEHMYDESLARVFLASKNLVKEASRQVKFAIDKMGLLKSDEILDVPCGVGRHSLLLAKKGYSVTGVDISPGCLKIAKSEFAHSKVKYRAGNMNDLSRFHGKFDAVLNLCTSFGYFKSDNANKRVLREMFESLRPGGRVLLHTVDRDFARHYGNDVRRVNFRNFWTVSKFTFDQDFKYAQTETLFFFKDKKRQDQVRHQFYRLRYYSRKEMESLMTQVGFKDIQVFGNFDGDKFILGKTAHPIYIGTR